MNITKIVEMYNNEGLTLKEIGDRLNISKSTVQRKLAKENFKLNKSTGRYESTIDNKTCDDNKHNVVDETTNDIEYINRTYAIDKKMDRALKIKSAVENKKVIDIVRKALESYVEDKYLNM